MPGSPAWFATTPQAEQATYFRNRCVSYGFEPGTPAMAQCIQNESISSRGRASARANAAFANMQNSQPKTTALAGFGLSTADIACVLATDEQDLKATYAHELESGAIKANARVAESLYRKATGEGREPVTAAIFWLKTRARWKETSIHELEGKLDTSVTFVTTYEDMKLL